MKYQKEFDEFVDYKDFVFILANEKNEKIQIQNPLLTESAIVRTDDEFENNCEDNGGDDDDVDVNDDDIADFLNDYELPVV